MKQLKELSREELIALIGEYRSLVDQAWCGLLSHEGCEGAYQDWIETLRGERMTDGYLDNVARLHDKALVNFLEPIRGEKNLKDAAVHFGWEFLGPITS